MKIFIQDNEGHKVIAELTRPRLEPQTANEYDVLIIYSELEDNYISPERIKHMFEALIGNPITIRNEIVKTEIPINIKETIKW